MKGNHPEEAIMLIQAVILNLFQDLIAKILKPVQHDVKIIKPHSKSQKG